MAQATRYQAAQHMIYPGRQMLQGEIYGATYMRAAITNDCKHDFLLKAETKLEHMLGAWLKGGV